MLPAAILQETKVGIARVAGDSEIKLANLDRDAYPDLTFPADPAQPMPTEHTWGSYFLAAYKGVAEYCAAKGVQFDVGGGGLRVVVTGTVPLGSGLSSSAALVCASALALLGVAGVEASKKVWVLGVCACV